ncbi:hypothetical protein [Halobacterium sp. R2-5]|uniref:DUF7260 family protein n=1 Tax=Halobacterium sp. R2-5 TaxID=2715751 RepID=UPI0014245F2C|nr:hypothetical protein [Halobacterium sp. R2-5]NIC01017.1 hypothetical protein [Halobacterium sp. R2-5]
MDVPHYERVYDETLVEHFKNEFGPKYVGIFEDATSAAFTPQYKSALQLKVRETVKRREEVLRMLDVEEKSVRDAWTSLEEICSPLQTTVIPDWYTDSFTTRLDAIAAARQERLQERDDLDHTQGLSLCAYAYDDQPWTYPVLTSVARVRETVTFER